MLKKLYILVFSGLVLINSLLSQEKKVVVQDKFSRLPVGSAHIQLRDLSGKMIAKTTSDQKGEIVLHRELPLIISVSCLSYKPYCDSISGPDNDTILLSPDYYQLDHVVVTGQFRPQPVDKSIYKIDVIDNRQIQLKAANNMGDLLRTNLSFQYRPEGVLGDFLKIRGLSGENIKVLIDGMPITGRVADRIDLGQLNLLNVDHIEIIEGPMSVLYGSNALAGAINIITSTNTSTSKKLSATANTYYESVGVYNFNASVLGKTGKNTFSVNAARNFHPGWGPFDTARWKIWKPKLQYLVGGWYRYNKNNLKVTYGTDYLHEELRDLDSLSKDGEATDIYYFTQRWNNRFNLYNQLHDDFIINLQAGYSYYSVRKISYDNNLVLLEKTQTNLDTTTFHMATARGVISNIPGKMFEYQAGFDYSFEQALGAKITGTKNITEAASFLNFIFTPYEMLSLQPGVRAIYNSKYRAPLVYAMNVKFTPGSFAIRGSYAKGFKAPSLKQLYLLFVDNNHTISGNENLLPEIANNFSLSTDYHIQDKKHSVEAGVSFFYNSSINAIQLAVDTNRPGWGVYFNLEDNKYRTKGIETRLAYHFMQRITLQVGYSLTGRSRLDEVKKFEYSGDIASSFSYRSHKYNFELAAFYKYSDDYLEFNGNFNADGKLSGIAHRYVDPYHTLDITLSKPLFQNKLNISGGVKNLFDITLVDSRGTLNYHGSGGNSTAVGYGRTYFIKINFQIDKF